MESLRKGMAAIGELPGDIRGRLVVRDVPFGDIYDPETGNVYISAPHEVRAMTGGASTWRFWAGKMFSSQTKKATRNLKEHRGSLSEAVITIWHDRQMKSVWDLYDIPRAVRDLDKIMADVRRTIEDIPLSGSFALDKDGVPFCSVTWVRN